MTLSPIATLRLLVTSVCHLPPALARLVATDPDGALGRVRMAELVALAGRAAVALDAIEAELEQPRTEVAG